MDDPFEYRPGPERSRELFQELKELDEKYPEKEYPETLHPRKYEIIHDLAEGAFLRSKGQGVKRLSFVPYAAFPISNPTGEEDLIMIGRRWLVLLLVSVAAAVVVGGVLQAQEEERPAPAGRALSSWR